MSLFDDLFARAPVMGIYRGLSLEDTLKSCFAAWDAGVAAVEIPVQNDAAFRALAAAAEEARTRGAVVGAGTVRTRQQLMRARDAGAAFSVAPGLNLDIVAAANEIGLPHLPGVATSTEIDIALTAGATWLKAFPASELGPEWVRAQRAPFPEARFVATGGMSAHNAKLFLNAGCSAVALGGALSEPSQLARLREHGLLPERE